MATEAVVPGVFKRIVTTCFLGDDVLATSAGEYGIVAKLWVEWDPIQMRRRSVG